MRVFYAVYVEEPFLRHLLNGIRLLCNPQEKHSAHITVRGPYRQHYHFDAQNDVIRGSVIDVNGVGRFWNEHQNTVFLPCDSPKLRHVWYKPDYPEYSPHITIYDGGSRAFAQGLFELLERCSPRFHFGASELRPLVSTGGQNTFDLAASLDASLLSRVAQERFPIGEVSTLDENHRLRLIEKLCRRLGRYKNSPSTEATLSRRSIRRLHPKREATSRSHAVAKQLFLGPSHDASDPVRDKASLETAWGQVPRGIGS